MKKFIRFFVFAVGVLLVGRVYAAAEVYKVDAGHSSVGFSTKHLMVSTVNGSFDEYEGAITYDPADPKAFKADLTIQAKSIDTNQEKRDAHLRNADFLDADKFPTITFVSKSLSGGEGSYTLTGDLTIKGVTKEISFPVTVSGPVQSPMGGAVIGLDANFTINRQDYGVSWSKAMDNGGLVVSNDVAVKISLEAVKK